MGYIQQRLAAVLHKQASKRQPLVVGTVGWAPTPRGPDHLWPCCIADPDDPSIPPTVLSRFRDTEGQKVMITFFLGEFSTTEPLPVTIVKENSFIHWGTPAQDFVEFVGALASVAASAGIAASFIRSVSEAHDAFSSNQVDGPKRQSFSVGWTEAPGFPLWPCVSISTQIARYFNLEVCCVSVALKRLAGLPNPVNTHFVLVRSKITFSRAPAAKPTSTSCFL
jgi:hypothetical protein